MFKYKKRVLFLYYDPHYFHSELAKALKADFYPSLKLKSEKTNMFTGGLGILRAVFTLPRDYDIYFCEGTYIIPALAKKFGLIKKDAKIVNILASPLLYYIKTGLIKRVRQKFAIELLKEVDLFLCLGKMEDRLLKEIIPDAKSIVVYPVIKTEVNKKFIGKKVNLPYLNRHKILTIGTNSAYYKGIDITFESFKIVKKRFPDSELTIAGNINDLNKYVDCNYPGVHCIGYAKDVVKLIKNSSLYVHMGRGDTFPLSSLEAMLGGLPTIVSEWTGTKEVVQNINSNYIAPLKSRDLADIIINHFNKKATQKKALSIRFREAAIEFSKRDIIKNFKLNFDKYG
jgi:glycosyltransferase involved in cell wall biosynthesis